MCFRNALLAWLNPHHSKPAAFYEIEQQENVYRYYAVIWSILGPFEKTAFYQHLILLSVGYFF